MEHIQPDNIPYADMHKKPLKALSPKELLELDIPEPKWLLKPFVPQSGLVQVFADRGVGKTFFVLGLVVALASGKSFLGYKPTDQYRIVWYDGEMSTSLFKERVNLLISQLTELERAYFNDNVRIVLSGEQEFGMPDIGDPESYFYYDHWLEHVDLIVFDNLMSLTNLAINDNDSWGGFNNWCISLRNRGITVMHVHHTGRGGGKHGMGAKRLEQPLDLIIGLRKPADYEMSQGCDFNIEFTKSRRFLGEDAAPMRAMLDSDGKWHRLEYAPEHDWDALQKEHGSVRNIAKATGVSKSEVQRKLKEASVPNQKG
jgi:putative DNA primase/helicase